MWGWGGRRKPGEEILNSSASEEMGNGSTKDTMAGRGWPGKDGPCALTLCTAMPCFPSKDLLQSLLSVLSVQPQVCLAVSQEWATSTGRKDIMKQTEKKKKDRLWHVVKNILNIL